MSQAIDVTQLQPLRPGDLKMLAGVCADVCVSILMRTHRSGRETMQGPIRLKNLIKQATERLHSQDQDTEILDRLETLMHQTDFWQHQGEGLAIYLTAQDCHLVRLNHPIDEFVHVGESFLIAPLVAESNASGEFFLLSLSWDEATLYRVSDESLEVTQTESLPAKFDQLVLPRDPEEQLQNTSHRSVGNTPGTSTGMFHGQGEGEDKIRADRDQYLSIVGDEVAGTIYNTGVPLVIVATTEVAGHFDATTKLSIAAKVEGSPNQWSRDELRQRAWQALRAEAEDAHAVFLERFGTASASSQGSDDIDAVMEAAQSGRVAKVMVGHDPDRMTQINQIVAATLRNGGDVLCGDTQAMPSGSGVAAIYRY